MADPHGKRVWLASLVAVCCAASCWMPGRLSERPLRAEEAAREPLEVRLWRAGRVIPPGLSAARVSELEAERERARADLAAGLAVAEEERLATWLASGETPDELWCAAVRAAAALERYDLAEHVATGLDGRASPHRAVAARTALHALYGRWFERPAELQPYLASVAAGPGTRLLLEAARAEEHRSRERLFNELVHAPAGAAAWLADPDPEVRSGAARILTQVFRSEGSAASGALETLIAHLEGEFEPYAFHEGLHACLEALERLDVDQPSSARLRALLVEIARAGGDPRSLSAAQAIARIPWRRDGARDLGHLLSGIDVLGAMLRGLAEADRVRGLNDPDPSVAVLAALRELCARASACGLASELRESAAGESLFAVLRDPEQEDAVRAAAAAALGPMARPSDAAQLAEVLADPLVGSQVKHALLGALRAILPELAPGDAGAHGLLDAVATLTGAGDSDLRRRALALCAEPRLEPLVRGLDPSFLVERLGREDGRDATLELLRLIQRFGREDMLAALLGLERFEALCADPVLLEALAVGLERLVGRSGESALRAAERLAAARSEETGLARLRHALALVARLDAAAALALDPRAHRSVTTWVWRVVRAGVAPRDLAPGGLAFEQRLLEVHLPRAAAAEALGLGIFETAHLTALLRADLFLGGAAGGVERGTKPQVEAAFESAYGLAGAPELRLLVLRDRARFRAAANECVKALSDYRRLFEAGDPSEALLGIPDLRSAVELLVRFDETGGQGTATAGEACELLRRLVERSAWRAEPASVRMQDLRDWVRMALDSGALEPLRQVEIAFAELPMTQLEAQVERDSPPLWFGLTREADWFQELLDLRARVRIGLREIEARG